MSMAKFIVSKTETKYFFVDDQFDAAAAVNAVIHGIGKEMESHASVKIEASVTNADEKMLFPSE
jgi:hypothetical protein